MTDVPTGSGSFIVVGMSEYDHYENLEHVKRAVPELCDALAGCQFTHVLHDLTDGGSFQKVTTLLSGWRPQAANPLIIYWAGHGTRQANGEYLLVRDSPRQDLHGLNAMSAKVLASLMAVWPIQHAIVIIDACHSGASARDIAREFDDALTQQTFPNSRPTMEIVASCGPLEKVQDGHFTERFTRVLREGGSSRDWAPGNEFVYVSELLDALDADAGSQSESLAEARIIGRPKRVIPNPRAIAGLPPADAHVQRERQQRILDLGLRDHFRQAARGIEVDEIGWFFFGRTTLLRELVSWFDDGPGGLRVITGSPGTGKSAVLGRIATLSHTAYRQIAVAEGALIDADSSAVPRAGLIDVAVHGRNKSLAECQDAIAAGLGIASPSGGWRTSSDLIDAINGLGRPVRILVDALDEARRESVLAIATDLIRRLAQQRNVRVAVGTRTHAVGSAAADGVIGRGPLIDLLTIDSENVRVLDYEEHTTTDIAGYVMSRLTRAPASPYRDDPVAAQGIATAVANASGQIFLFARIVTRALLARDEPLPLDSDEVRRFLSGQVRDVFVADLARFGPDELRARELLAPLAWAEGAGFPRVPVWPAVATALSPTGARYGVSDIDWLLDIAGYHVSETSEDGQAVYRLYHQAFADYFRSERTGSS